MILLVFVLLALVVALLSGGNLRNLAHIQVTHSYLILVSLGIQIVVFSTWWHERIGESLWGEILYALSLLLLVGVVWVNRRVPGLALLGVGLTFNALVILANGGRLPASLQALRTAGIAEAGMAYAASRATNSMLMDESTRLWYLGDIFAIPRGFPLANVYSIGDVLIALGAAWFIFGALRPRSQRPAKGD